ncbi:MAG: NAD(P)-dependent oxidoreductase [Polynucleobacter sp.]|jgi:3-hydroxyisobutyrate dehydrogenase|nr:NAD(P)-dependent oxidoreductase [Polynucleobacter sp.]
MKIGLIGTGRMGGAIVQRLLACGHEVTVWNRSMAKTEPLVELGAKTAASPSAVVAACEITISILTDGAAIDSAYRGAGGVLEADLSGKLLIEMSTVRPSTSIALAKDILAKGGGVIDCPVGGTVGPARDGKLFGLVGGSDEDVAKAKPILDQLCRRVEHVGPNGSGATLKLSVNLPLLVFWQSFSEALSISSKLDISPERLIDILSDTSGAPNMLKARAPAIVASLKGQVSPNAAFTLDNIRKDLRTMIEEAKSMGWDIPVTIATLKEFDKTSAAGLGEADGLEVPAWFIKTHSK